MLLSYRRTIKFGTMAEKSDADNQYVCGLSEDWVFACTHKLHVEVRIFLVPPHYGNPNGITCRRNRDTSMCPLLSVDRQKSK